MQWQSGLAFFAVVMVIAVIYILSTFRTPKAAVDYFKNNPTGRRAWRGISLFIGIPLILVSIAVMFVARADASENWFAYGQVYLGAEHTSDLNTICDAGGVDDRIVSHGGVRVNLYRSTDRKFETNVKYTHHSCAFGGDNHVYDAAGLEASYKLWGD